MKPLFTIVATILVLAANAQPENIEDVKQLPQNKEFNVEAEESEPQARVERCTTCSGVLNLKSPKDVLAAIQTLPGSEVHTQQSFEGCSSDKGCAGLKVKDGRVVERFGNVDAFRNAASSDTANEFTFHSAGALDKLQAGLGGENAPFWWMDQNSPFKNAATSGSFEKFSKTSSSGYSTSGNANGLDLSSNPFLNGGLSNAGGFIGAGAVGSGVETKPTSFQSSSFESSSFSSSNKGGVDLSNNPFLNGALAAGSNAFGAGLNSAQNGFTSTGQSGFNEQAFSGASGSKFGYTGSSPRPFTASTAGPNVNLIQNTQKASEFGYQQTQNIDEAFQNTGNVIAPEYSGGDLQQTCAGQGYVCVPKAQCNNGVVNTNGAGILQANTQKQYCNVRNEICCRLETSSLAGAGSLQGSLGVDSATFSNGANEQGVFVTGQSTSNQNSFGQSGSFGQTGSYGQTGSTVGLNTGSTGFGANQGSQTASSFGSASGSVNRDVSVGSTNFEATRGSSFNNNNFNGFGTGIGSTIAPATAPSRFGSGNFNNEVYKATSQSNFIETDTFSAGSQTANSYRPGSPNSGLKPGIPYLPPVESATSSTNLIESTVITPRPFSTPRPAFTPRPTTRRPTFSTVGPSTSAPGYLPSIGESTNTRETRIPPNPTYKEGQLILDDTRQPAVTPLSPSDIPAGCAAALKCTPIEYCTAEGVISNTTVILTKQQASYRVPLTDCRDVARGLIGKCCRDPLYTDPWPTNQLGKWVPGVFGGNDGKYVPDSRSSPNNLNPQVTVRPPVTGSVILNANRQTKPTVSPFGPNQVTPGYGPTTVSPGSFIQKGQFEIQGQGSYGQKGQGQYGVGGLGQTSQGAQGQYGQGSQLTQTTSPFGLGQGQGQIVSQGAGLGVTQGFGQSVSEGQGQSVSQGFGQSVSQGFGQGVSQGFGQGVSQGFGQGVTQGLGQTVSQGQGLGVSGGFGQTVSKGQGQSVTQGFGQGVTQGVGQTVSQGQGFGVSGGFGQTVSKGQGQSITQGFGQSVSQGVGQSVSQGFGQFGQGQVVSKGQGQIVKQGSGQVGIQGVGQGVLQGFGQTVSQGTGQISQFGQGQIVSKGQGQIVKQGFGQTVSKGVGQVGFQGVGQDVSQGFGQGVSQGFGQGVSQGFGQGVSQGQGQAVSQGQGQYVSQGFGQTVTQGQGQIISKGQGQIVKQGVGQAVTQGQGAFGLGGRGQIGIGGQGVFGQGGQGQEVITGTGQSVETGSGFGVITGGGQTVSQGSGSEVITGQGQGITQGIGFGVTTGQGQYVKQGQGFLVTGGQGQAVTQGFGQSVKQGFGQTISQGQGLEGQSGAGFGVIQGSGRGVINGRGQALIQGQGQTLEQGFGTGVKEGQGYTVAQGGGVGVENEYGESVQRVFLQQFNGGSQCGVLNGQKPYGNRDDLEVDFAEIPWQAMILLQTNRSLLCGGVITRPDVVITSAACVDGLEAKNVLIKGGEWKLGIDEEPLPFQIVQVQTILRHPFYKRGSLKYDAAILVLSENLRFSKNIYPICLPGSSETLDAYYNGAGECMVTGWGKQVLQAHLLGSIMHSINVSLINPGECETKITQDYPHLLEQYERDSCVCAEPTNPVNNICKVDIGSALACTTGDGHFVFRGLYSWDSGCQAGNQLAAFFKFDLEWYEWAIGLIESVRFAKFTIGTKVIHSSKYSGQINSGIKSTQYTSGVKGTVSGVKGVSGVKEFGQVGQGFGQVGQGFGQFSQFGSSKFTESENGGSGINFKTDIKPISNTFSAVYTEKKVFQSEPKYVTYTTKPEIVTFTTKPEYFTFTTKPKIVTYTTKPEIVTYTTKPEIVTYTTKPEIVTYTTKPEIITYTTKPKIIRYTTKPKIVNYTTKPQFIRYETSGSANDPQYVVPGITFNPSFSDIVGQHKHSASCKCDKGKK